MRIVAWVWLFAAVVRVAGCDSDNGACADSSEVGCDLGSDPRMCVDPIGSGARKVGCACSTEGQFACIQTPYSGLGLSCFHGVWQYFADYPCWPPADAWRPIADVANDN